MFFFSSISSPAAYLRSSGTCDDLIGATYRVKVGSPVTLQRGDDLEQLEAGMLLYDAFYRWCRDATEETHDWVSHTPRARRK